MVEVGECETVRKTTVVGQGTAAARCRVRPSTCPIYTRRERQRPMRPSTASLSSSRDAVLPEATADAACLAASNTRPTGRRATRACFAVQPPTTRRWAARAPLLSSPTGPPPHLTLSCHTVLSPQCCAAAFTAISNSRLTRSTVAACTTTALAPSLFLSSLIERPAVSLCHVRCGPSCPTAHCLSPSSAQRTPSLACDLPSLFHLFSPLLRSSPSQGLSAMLRALIHSLASCS